MTRPAACVVCRQNKLRCNASSTYPEPCSRCVSRSTLCKIDTTYKRVPTRNRIERLTQEIERLKGGIDMQTSNENESNITLPDPNDTSLFLDTLPRTENISEHESVNSVGNSVPSPEPLFILEDLVLHKSDVDECFQEYFHYYHPQFPLVDTNIKPSDIIDQGPILFWTIIFTASKHLSSQKMTFNKLTEKLPNILSKLMIQHDDSVYTIQGLLILSMWPPKVNRVSDDMRWTYSGMAMQLAMQAGFHRVGYEHEYHAFNYSKSSTDEHTHTRIWRSWCFVNAVLSCELGLPCLVPFDALEIKAIDIAALPPDFLSKLRIVLYISRINDSLGDSTVKSGSHKIRMVRLLERDLNSLIFELRRSTTQWNCSVEFIYLGILLNLYSFCLRWSSPVSINDPDHTLIQSTAAQSAKRLIQLFSTSPFPTQQTSSLGLGLQKYCPKFYLRFHMTALLTLLKISVLNQVSIRELGEVDDSVRLGHSAVMSCSTTEGDEYHRAAAVVEVLCKKGVIDSVRGESAVESRFGASLVLELIATAIRWRRQHFKKGPKPAEARGLNTGNKYVGSSDTTTSNVLTDALTAGSDNLDTFTLAMDDMQGAANLFPFSIGDWSAYADVLDASLGLANDQNW